MAFFNKSQTEILKKIALDAGKIALKYHKSANLEIKKKPDGSKVSNADIETSEFIKNELQNNFPDIKIICEEQELREFDDDIFFLIDPIDGTSAYLKGRDDFCINIALIKNKKAVFGLIYAPAFEGGKMIFSNENDKIILNDEVLKFVKKNIDILRIITSSRNHDAEIQLYISDIEKKFTNNFTIRHLSSAIKFIEILENKADIFIACNETSEWDTAAGQALIEILGGKVEKITKKAGFFYQNHENIEYKKKDFLNPYFIAYF